MNNIKDFISESYFENKEYECMMFYLVERTNTYKCYRRKI